MAALSFAVVEAIYSFFYSPFGLRPEEVGIDRSTIIARALFGMVSFLAIAVALIGFCSLPIRALGAVMRKRHQAASRIPSTDIAWLVAAFIPLIPAYYFLTYFYDVNGTSLWPLGVGLAAGISWLFAWWRLRRVRHNPHIRY